MLSLLNKSSNWRHWKLLNFIKNDLTLNVHQTIESKQFIRIFISYCTKYSLFWLLLCFGVLNCALVFCTVLASSPPKRYERKCQVVCCFFIIIYLQIFSMYVSRNLLLSRINDEHCLFIVACLCRVCRISIYTVFQSALI